MNLLPTLPSWLAAAFGWTLVHSLWQIALIFLLFKIAAFLLRRHAEAMYAASLLAMLASAAWTAITFGLQVERLRPVANSSTEALAMELAPAAAPLEQQTIIIQNAAPATTPETWLDTAAAWLDAHAVLLGWTWCLGVLLCAFRLLGGWWLSRRLRSRDTQEAEGIYQNNCSDWARRLGLRRAVRLLESPHVAEPLTLGFWKPVVLFPAGLMLRLSPAEVEALLLHELAHIRRHDYLVNLLQLALEAVFFYHPLFWLLSRNARTTREHCCDDVVLRRGANPLLYARLLTDLKLSLSSSPNSFAMNAFGKSHFSARILRIAGLAPTQPSGAAHGFILLLLIASVLLASWWPAPGQASVSAFFTLPENAVSEKENSPVPDRREPVRITLASQPFSDTLPPRQGAVVPVADHGPTMPIVAVEPTKVNVLYIGVDNPLTITAPGYDCAQVSARLVGPGTLVPKGNCQYVATVTEQGTVDIQVFATVDGKESMVGSSVFRVKRLPPPAPTAESPKTVRAAEPGIHAEVTPEPRPGPVAIQVDKMNVLYIGVDNPIRVAVEGVSASSLDVVLVGNNGEVTGSDGLYNVRVWRPGVVKLFVNLKDALGVHLLTAKEFRVQRVPDPTLLVSLESEGGKSQPVHPGSVSLEFMKGITGISTLLENFAYEGNCNVLGFEMTVLPHKKDPIVFNATSSEFPAGARTLIQTLEVGSAIFIDNIKVLCPGDAAPRNLGGLAFKIRE